MQFTMSAQRTTNDEDAVSRYNALSSLAPPSRRNSTNNNATGDAAASGDANSLASKRSLDDELASLASEIDEVFTDTEGSSSLLRLQLLQMVALVVSAVAICRTEHN